MNNVLIVANTSYAGMGPYVSEIVNDFLPEDNVFFLFRDYDDDFFFKNIKKELHSKSTFVKIPNTRWNTLVDLVSSKNRLLNYIIDICHKKEIGLVHFINAPAEARTYRILLNAGVQVISTIHDLQAHEANKEWYKMVRHKLMYKKLAKNVKIGDCYITNSRYQEQILKESYPEKKVFYHPFPSLVTDIVKSGEDIPEELKGLKKPYILFFGRIEEYKGLSLLYEAFITSSELSKNYCLVIAGKGTNATISDGQDEGVVFINRYIKDTEVAYLYKNARTVVYPYISATQSGVLTLAFYFGTPIIASDVSFFKELIHHYSNGVLFCCGDKEDLKKKLLELLNNDVSKMICTEKEYYKSHYTKGVQRNSLINIYNNFLEDKTEKRNINSCFEE